MFRILLTISFAIILTENVSAHDKSERPAFVRIVKFMKSKAVHSVRLEFKKQADKETRKLVEAALTQQLKASGIAVVTDRKTACFFTVQVRLTASEDGSVVRTRFKLHDHMGCEMAGFSPFLDRELLVRLAALHRTAG